LLLNAGYKKGSPAIRCEGDDHRVVEFRVYAPKVIASIRGLENVLESRCIRVTMLRTTGPKGNRVVSESGEDWATVRHWLYCFALLHFAGVRRCYLDGAGADVLSNRQAELWCPLLAIAAYLKDLGVDDILDKMRHYAESKAAHADEAGLDDWRTALVLALNHLVESADGQTGCPSAGVRPKEVRQAMAHFMDPDDHARVTSQWVGYRLRELGFQRERDYRGSVYAIDRHMVKDIMLRYDVKEPQAHEEPRSHGSAA
jgi:hypothetical protein